MLLAFSGLDSAQRYEVVVYSDRGESKYTGVKSRGHFGTIIGAESFSNASTPGTTWATDIENHQPGDSTLYNVGDNSDAGFVTRFVDIDPGADGNLAIRLKQGVDATYSSYFSEHYSYANAVMIRTIPKPRSFVAYNDLAWFAGQPNLRISSYTTPNGNNAGINSGALVDHNTGIPLDATLTVTGGRHTFAQQGLPPAEGTDANSVFGNKVDGTGTISYGDEDLVLEFANLDPSLQYELVLYSDRGNANYTGDASRGHFATIMGAEHFTNASTDGTFIVVDMNNHMPDDSTLYNAGDNHSTGFVTRFVDVEPGADGQVSIRLKQHVDPTYASYFSKYYSYANAVMLRAYEPTLGGGADAGPECDDGNNVDGDGCNASCVIEFCGDGIKNNGVAEECDDGNNVGGDGCNANCRI